MMRFYKQPHAFYCGVDLHARMLYLCVFNQAVQAVPLVLRLAAVPLGATGVRSNPNT
jgi:hypothetical protein